MRPEDVAQDLAATRRLVEQTSPEEFARIVQGFRQASEDGDLAAIWEGRCRFGISAGDSHMGSDDWFWFNAFAALAGLKLRKLPGFPLDNYCGLADVAASWGDSEHQRVKGEINRLYFGK